MLELDPAIGFFLDELNCQGLGYIKNMLGRYLLIVMIIGIATSGLGSGWVPVSVAKETPASAIPKVSAAGKIKEHKQKKVKQNVFAVVGGEVVRQEEFLVALRKDARKKFYHGKITDKELVEFRQAVADTLIENTLLVQEAHKRGIQYDKSKINEKIKEKIRDLDKIYSENEGWETNRETVLEILEKRLIGEQLIEKLRKVVRDMPTPAKADVKEYYNKYPDKFTEPEEWHVSLIMLKIDPASTKTVWQEAIDKAGVLVEQLRGGAEFEELAMVHSGDESAENGGDMGYLHIGMLAQPAQNVLNTMKPGDLSEPVVLLAGVAIFRLNGVQPAELNPFERVAERASDLLHRQLRQQAWMDLKAHLKKSIPYTVNEKFINQVSSARR